VKSTYVKSSHVNSGVPHVSLILRDMGIPPRSNQDKSLVIPTEASERERSGGTCFSASHPLQKKVGTFNFN
jgi:hypothetical protein